MCYVPFGTAAGLSSNYWVRARITLSWMLGGSITSRKSSFLAMWYCFIVNDIFLVIFVYSWNWEFRTDTLALHSLWTSGKFRLALSKWPVRRRLPPRRTWMLLPTISGKKTKSSGIVSSKAVRMQLPGRFCVCLFFLTVFSSWLQQNSPLRDKDNQLLTELFLQFAY